MNEIRKLVSRDKYRYKDENFDLDLTFITKRIIAMGLPGEKLNTVWRNDIDDVAEFFNSNFGEHYLIVNLSQVAYDYHKFHNRVVDYGFPDHNCPPLQLLFEIIEAMDRFLQEDERNVVAVHCLAGRGRTGTVIAAYLLFSKQFDNAQEALQFFGKQRSKQNEGVIGPSQIRYVEYYERIILKGFPYKAGRRMLLKQITITPVPAIEIGEKTRGSCTPALKIYSSGQLVYSSMERSAENFKREEFADVNLDIGAMVSDDVQVKVYHRAKSKMKFAEIIGSCKLNTKETVAALSKYPYIPLFRFTFNTAFVSENMGVITLAKRDLDAPFAGVAREAIFPRNMTVSSFLLDQDMMTMAHIPTSTSSLSNLKYPPPSASAAASKRSSSSSSLSSNRTQQPQSGRRVSTTEPSPPSLPSQHSQKGTTASQATKEAEERRKQEVLRWVEDSSPVANTVAEHYSTQTDTHNNQSSYYSSSPSLASIPTPTAVPVPSHLRYPASQPTTPSPTSLPHTAYPNPTPVPSPFSYSSSSDTTTSSQQQSQTQSYQSQTLSSQPPPQQQSKYQSYAYNPYQQPPQQQHPYPQYQHHYPYQQHDYNNQYVSNNGNSYSPWEGSIGTGTSSGGPVFVDLPST